MTLHAVALRGTVEVLRRPPDPKPVKKAILCCLVLAAAVQARPDGSARLLESPHFDVYYAASDREAARQAALLAERWYAELSIVFGRGLDRRHALILHSTAARFRLGRVGDGMLSASSGGVTDGSHARIALPFGVSLAETEHVLGHEIVHAFQYEAAARSHPPFPALPAWFVEGMAECLSLGPQDPAVLSWMREAWQQAPPALSDLASPAHGPYRGGHAAWRFLIGRYGADVARRLLEAPGRGLDPKLRAATGLTLRELSDQWQQTMAAELRRVNEPTRRQAATATAMARGRVLAHGVVGPSISPDGRLLAWAVPTEPGELWLANSASGALRLRLLDPDTNPRYDSLHLLDSAGAWEPAGRRLALAASRGGRALLVIVDAATGHCERELPLNEPGEITGVSWSPDGRRLAFSGQAGGWTDLYVFELGSRALRRLTSDAFADLQPAWLPDARSLVFATDRFTTDITALRPGPYRLALIDTGTGAAREVPGTRGGRNVSPRVTSGGEILFVGDPDGHSSIYRLSATHESIARLTPAGIEVSGPTPLTPALTTTRGQVLAYSAFRRGRYEVVLARLPESSGPTMVASLAR